MAAAASFDGVPEVHALAAPRKLALALARSDISTAWARLADDGSAAVLALLAQLPGSLCLGTVCLEGMTVFAVEDNVWQVFGDWCGRRVDAALLSWGFLSNMVWTVGFQRYVYRLVLAVHQRKKPETTRASGL